MSEGFHVLGDDVYHADQVADEPSLTRSIIHLLCTASPLHAWTAHPKLNPAFERDHDQKFDLGTAAHEVLLGGESSVRIVEADDWRTSAAKELRDLAREEGKLPLLEKHWHGVKQMVAAAREQLADLDLHPPLFTDGASEITMVWRDRGVLCRARLDWLRTDGRAIDDLKTTSRSANPESWGRSMFSSGYDIQACFYLRGVAALGSPASDFRFVVLENQPPYALSVISPGQDALALANEKIEWALALWEKCLRDDHWPGYPRAIRYAHPPAWSEAEWLAKTAVEEAA